MMTKNKVHNNNKFLLMILWINRKKRINRKRNNRQLKMILIYSAYRDSNLLKNDYNYFIIVEINNI